MDVIKGVFHSQILPILSSHKHFAYSEIQSQPSKWIDKMTVQAVYQLPMSFRIATFLTIESSPFYRPVLRLKMVSILSHSVKSILPFLAEIDIKAAKESIIRKIQLVNSTSFMASKINQLALRYAAVMRTNK